MHHILRSAGKKHKSRSGRGAKGKKTLMAELPPSPLPSPPPSPMASIASESAKLTTSEGGRSGDSRKTVSPPQRTAASNMQMAYTRTYRHAIDMKSRTDSRQRMTVPQRLKYNRKMSLGGYPRQGTLGKKTTHDCISIIWFAVFVAFICSLAFGCHKIIQAENIQIINVPLRTLTDYCQDDQGACYFSSKWYVENCSWHMCHSLKISVAAISDTTGANGTYYKIVFEPRSIDSQGHGTNHKLINNPRVWKAEYGPPCKLTNGDFGRCSTDGQCHETLSGYFDKYLDRFIRKRRPVHAGWGKPTSNYNARTACEERDPRVSGQLIAVEHSGYALIRLANRECNKPPPALYGHLCWSKSQLGASNDLVNPSDLPWQLLDTSENPAFELLECSQFSKNAAFREKYSCQSSRLKKEGQNITRPPQFNPCCFKDIHSRVNAKKGRCFMGICLTVVESESSNNENTA